MTPDELLMLRMLRLQLERAIQERDIWKARHEDLLERYLKVTAPPDDEDLSMNEGY